MAKSKGKSKSERIHSAAVVKMKYLITTGKIDSGFKFIYDGVLKDLSLSESEVDEYIEKNKESLTRLCISGEQ